MDRPRRGSRTAGPGGVWNTTSLSVSNSARDCIVAEIEAGTHDRVAHLRAIRDVERFEAERPADGNTIHDRDDDDECDDPHGAFLEPVVAFVVLSLVHS